MNPFHYYKTKFNEIFADVKMLYHDDVEDLMRSYVLQALKQLLEHALKAEFIGYLRAGRYQHRWGKLINSFGLFLFLG
ncbi:MAG: hypothetical protein ACUVUH_09860 [bacterium]